MTNVMILHEKLARQNSVAFQVAVNENLRYIEESGGRIVNVSQTSDWLGRLTISVFYETTV